MSAPFRNLQALNAIYSAVSRPPPDGGLLSSVAGEAFFAGTDAINSTDNVRATLEIPAGVSHGAVVGRLIMGHDQSGLLPVEFIRRPSTGLPVTEIPALSTNTAAGSPPANAVVRADSGVAMGGGDGGAFLPSTSAAPNDLMLTTPIIVRPGDSVGLTADIGGLATSGSVMILVAWAELTTEELDQLLALSQA